MQTSPRNERNNKKIGEETRLDKQHYERQTAEEDDDDQDGRDRHGHLPTV